MNPSVYLFILLFLLLSGPRAALDDTSDRFKATKTDLRARFDEIDDDKTGTLGFEDIKKLSEKMSQPLRF